MDSRDDFTESFSTPPDGGAAVLSRIAELAHEVGCPEAWTEDLVRAVRDSYKLAVRPEHSQSVEVQAVVCVGTSGLSVEIRPTDQRCSHAAAPPDLSVDRTGFLIRSLVDRLEIIEKDSGWGVGLAKRFPWNIVVNRSGRPKPTRDPIRNEAVAFAREVGAGDDEAEEFAVAVADAHLISLLRAKSPRMLMQGFAPSDVCVTVWSRGSSIFAQISYIGEAPVSQTDLDSGIGFLFERMRTYSDRMDVWSRENRQEICLSKLCSGCIDADPRQIRLPDEGDAPSGITAPLPPNNPDQTWGREGRAASLTYIRR